jgi:ligand-binding sensor domain-containing protein/signal transduction histidine kinase
MWLGAVIGALGTPNFTSRVWLREAGLPQNMVSAVLQTHDGYLWVGTYNGLARFDGAHFASYNSGNTPALADSVVTSLFEDKDGTLWIGHETGEVTVYAQGHFQPAATTLRWVKKRILDIGADEAGDVWLCNEDGLLARVRDGLVLAPESGTETNVVEMTRSRRGVIWISRAGRVSVLQHGQVQPLNFPEAYTNLAVSAIGASHDGGVWMVVNQRLRKWKDGAWVEERGAAGAFTQSPMLRLIESRDGLLAGATSDQGLVLVLPDGTISQLNRSTRFCSDWVTSLCEDREGNLWVGTGGNGLAMVREGVVQTVAPPDAWQGRAVLSVCSDRANNLWVGTEGAGLYRCQNGVWTNYALANPYVWSLAQDSDGNLWAGTWGAGLYLWRRDGLTRLPALDPITMPMPALCPARQGGVWVGTTEGLLRCNAQGWNQWYGKGEISAPRNVRCVLECRAGDVWFGTWGQGLFHLQDEGLKQYSKADGLPDNFVRCLLEDETGAIWIGTSDGLGRFEHGHFAVLRDKQGLPDNVLCNIQDDGNGYFWISSFNGVFRAAKSDLRQCADGRLAAAHCLALSAADGLPSLEATGGGGRTADGKLWFATGSGLAAIDPQGVTTNPLAPPVLIEGLLVDNRPVEASGSPAPLRIPAGRHRFEFQYTALSFTAPEKVRFRHRLEKLDADWNDAGARRAADFPYIPPGDYTFHVIACNNDGIWNTDGAVLAFTVLPYFWQTTWFHLLGGLLAVLTASALVWFDTRRRMRRKVERLERQQAVEHERARIAKDIHDDLGASLTLINLLSQSALRDKDAPPQRDKNLNQICAMARQLTRAMDEIVWAVDPRHDTLDSLANYLAKSIHELLSPSGIRCRLDIPMDLPAWPVTADVRHNLFLAFKEALHNVLKHSGAMEVRIALELQPAAMVITISDNGHGFDAGLLTGDTVAGQPPLPRVNGLVNMRRRLREIGGRCEIQSQPGQGTQVRFFLAVKGAPK